MTDQVKDSPLSVRLNAIRYVARDTSIYELTNVAGTPLPPYAPGAHIDLHLPNGIVRQYSLLEPEPDPRRYMMTAATTAAAALNEYSSRPAAPN